MTTSNALSNVNFHTKICFQFVMSTWRFCSFADLELLGIRGVIISLVFWGFCSDLDVTITGCRKGTLCERPKRKNSHNATNRLAGHAIIITILPLIWFSTANTTHKQVWSIYKTMEKSKNSKIKVESDLSKICPHQGPQWWNRFCFKCHLRVS